MAAVKINGVTYDTEIQPCEIAEALRAVKIMKASGQMVTESEIRSPVSQRRIKVSEGSASDLDELIAFYGAACTLKTKGTRGRYAKRMRIVY